MEEVQMRSQANKQGQYQQGNWPQFQFPKQQYQKPTMVRDLTREVNSRLATTRATNLSTNEDPNLIKAADPNTTRHIKVKVRVKVKECNNPG